MLAPLALINPYKQLASSVGLPANRNWVHSLLPQRMLRSPPRGAPASRLAPPERRPAFSSLARGGSPNTRQKRSVSSAP